MAKIQPGITPFSSSDFHRQQMLSNIPAVQESKGQRKIKSQICPCDDRFKVKSQNAEPKPLHDVIIKEH